MTRREIYILTAAILLFGAAAFLPVVGTGYWLSIGITIVMYTVLATSWAVFSGPTNYISLATTAFFGLGMYVVGGGLDMFPMPVLILLAGLAGAVLAGVVGLATLRLSGVYFLIFTLGLAELVRQLMTWGQTTLGTSSGIFVFTDITAEFIYWELLGLAAAIYLIGWRIGRSRLGFALRVIGNDETVAVHSGINTARAKILLFIITGTFAALTGAVLAPRFTYIEPTIAFSPMLSILVVIMALLGGKHRLWGPLLGVIPFTFLWDFATGRFSNQSTLVLGITILLIVYAIPNGVVGLVENAFRRRFKAARHG
jgi:branched-chain amino acid transport system permease protein